MKNETPDTPINTNVYNPNIETWVSIRHANDYIVDKPFAKETMKGTISTIMKEIKKKYGSCYIVITQSHTGYQELFDIK